MYFWESKICNIDISLELLDRRLFAFAYNHLNKPSDYTLSHIGVL
jgi:hypothetical protein